MSEKTIWVLTDDRAGNNSQSVGLAGAIGGEVVIKEIRYNKMIFLPNVFRGASGIGVRKECLEALKPPFPDYAIAAGRRAAPVLRLIKKMSGGKTKIVQIMFPGRIGLDDYDAVVLPEHDGFTEKRPNVIRVVGAPNKITPERLAAEKAAWAERFADMPKPRVALIVGGATKDKPFTVDMAKDLAQKTVAFASRVGAGSLLVTTSRRTGAEQEKALKEALPDPKYFYGWGAGGENPYFGFLASADYIVVTGDSVSMCSESCVADAPVLIYAPEGSVGKKHALLHAELYEGGYAQPLTDDAKPLPHKRLCAAAEAAKAVLEKE